jgi:hypothetical protein
VSVTSTRTTPARSRARISTRRIGPSPKVLERVASEVREQAREDARVARDQAGRVDPDVEFGPDLRSLLPELLREIGDDEAEFAVCLRIRSGACSSKLEQPVNEALNAFERSVPSR